MLKHVQTIAAADLQEHADNIEIAARERGATFVRFLGIDNDELEVVEAQTLRIEAAGGLRAIARRCVGAGEEAAILDVVGFTLGRVACDGTLAWKR